MTRGPLSRNDISCAKLSAIQPLQEPLEMKTATLAAIVAISITPTAFAQVVVSYTFEDTFVPVVGSSISTASWNSGGVVGYASPFTGLGKALSVGAFQLNEYYQFTLNGTGFSDITFNNFRANGTDSAPKDWKISYSLDGVGGTFFDAGTFSISTSTAIGNTTITGFAFPSSADNQAAIVVRLIATTSDRIDINNLDPANGTFRIDNISFSAVAVPEPATYAAILGLLALGVVIWRRRRSAR